MFCFLPNKVTAYSVWQERMVGLLPWDLFSKLFMLLNFAPLEIAAWAGSCAAISLQFQTLNPYPSQPYLPFSPLQNHTA